MLFNNIRGFKDLKRNIRFERFLNNRILNIYIFGLFIHPLPLGYSAKHVYTGKCTIVMHRRSRSRLNNFIKDEMSKRQAKKWRENQKHFTFVSVIIVAFLQF